jgi:hypothetical protein
MRYYSTRESAKRSGIPHTTLATYLAAGKIPHPQSEIVGITSVQIWTEEEIEHVRLPRIANGRKTRYQKLQEKQKAQAKSSHLNPGPICPVTAKPSPRKQPLLLRGFPPRL